MTARPQPETPSALIFVLDGLRADALGTYGNTLVGTPAFDELAAQSTVFDWLIADSPSPPAHWRSVFHGTHVLSPDDNGHIAEAIRANSADTILFTDHQPLANSAWAEAFDRSVLVEPPGNTASQHAGDSHFAAFLAQLLELLSSAGDNCLVWVHSSGFYGPWDAPRTYRKRLADPEDPPPPTFVEPPHYDSIDDDVDDDWLLGFQQAYQAQLTLFDELWSIFYSQAEPLLAHWMIQLLSLRGFPLGEHGQIGASDCLHNENIHLPWMIKAPGKPGSTRTPKLVSPDRVHNIVTDWFAGNTETLGQLDQVLSTPATDAAITTSGSASSLQTQAWKLILQEPENKLFVKPDDRFEVNNVYAKCTGIAELMKQALGEGTDRLADPGEESGEFVLPEGTRIRLD